MHFTIPIVAFFFFSLSKTPVLKRMKNKFKNERFTIDIIV